MSRFPLEVEKVLRSSGWFPGRNVNVEKWVSGMPEFSWHERARCFLGEFGEVCVEGGGAGLSRYKEPFEINPICAYGEDDRFSDFSGRLDTGLAPLGELGQGEFFIAMDSSGMMYLLASEIFKIGVGDDALVNLVEGGGLERVVFSRGGDE